MLTIFTPIYNRKYIIHELYKSLQNQTCYEFEWIVIDDGSTDGVFDLLKDWEKNEDKFNITVERVENGGKHRAINKAVQLALGDAFYIVDSDDYISENAVELISKWWKTICDDDSFAGVSGLKAYKNTKLCVGDTVKFDDYIDATNLERADYGLLGDKAEVYRTSILAKYPFPEYEGENFLTEEIVWNRIAYDGLKIRWFNEVIYYCEYLEDGLTKCGKSIFQQNPKGWARWIHDSNVLGYWNKMEIMNNAFDFYEYCHENLDYDQVKEMLGLSMDEMVLIDMRYNNIVKQIKEIVEQKNYDSVAVYGCGNWGKRIITYFENIGIKISYVIDKNVLNYDKYVVKKMSDNFENVDCVCIAIKNVSDELKSKIIYKFPDAYVWTIAEEIEGF